MGFFGQFSEWLNGLLATYITDNTARIAAALEPAVITLGVLYVMIWGYLQLTGAIEEPFVVGVKKILALALIVGCALQGWLYAEVIVDTFFDAPGQLAGRIIGAYDSVTIVDEIINAGNETAERLNEKGGIFDGMSYYLAAVAVYVIVGLTAIYTIFLLSLAKIALSMLLALGPLFLALLLFDTTKRFFEAWIAQLANYALIGVLTVLAAALMLSLLRSATDQAVSTGDGITIAHAVRVCMTAGLAFLVMRQVMPMAAGLASGIALSTFGALSRGLNWAFGGAARRISHSGAQFSRGAVMDQETTRWDSLSRKAGFYTQQGARWLVRRDNRIGQAPASVPPSLLSGAKR
jgi:type IV secretion system protein VirB6